MPRPLPLSPSELERLIERHGTPLQIYSERGIRAAVRTLTNAFASAGFIHFREFYAVKALPNPTILTILKSEGCGLDCSSGGELWLGDKLGFEGKDIMYTSNYTSTSDLMRAIKQQVIINLDDGSLVNSLAAACAKTHHPFPELICFRLNPGTGNTSSETKSNLLGGPTAKFGVPLDQICQAYSDAKALGAKRFGIHMMTGSCVTDVEYWSVAVGKLLETAISIQKELGISFEFVNIGGGIGIPYRPDQPDVDVNKVANVVANEFTRYFGTDKKTWPKLYMENGRYITGPYGWLIARCNSVKQAFGTRFYGLDACMANLMRPGMYESYHHITVLNPRGEAKLLLQSTSTTISASSSTSSLVGNSTSSVNNSNGNTTNTPTTTNNNNTNSTSAPIVEACNVVGTLCENNDWFCKGRLLPRASPGDIFVIHDTGAHSHSMGFQYNSKLRAPEILIRDYNNESQQQQQNGQNNNREFSLIRRGEVIEDLFANTIIPSDLAKINHVPERVVGGSNGNENSNHISNFIHVSGNGISSSSSNGNNTLMIVTVALTIGTVFGAILLGTITTAARR
jgi:diaminopimelate decarboxylase